MLKPESPSLMSLQDAGIFICDEVQTLYNLVPNARAIEQAIDHMEPVLLGDKCPTQLHNVPQAAREFMVGTIKSLTDRQDLEPRYAMHYLSVLGLTDLVAS